MAVPFQYKEYLQDIFPNKSVRTIEEVIQIVQKETPNDPEEYKLENIINLLTETGEGSFNYNSSTSDNRQDHHENDDDEDDLLDEARGHSRIIDEQHLARYFEQLLTIFPDASPAYVKDLCHKQAKTCISLDTLIDTMTQVDYPKKEIDSKAIYRQLKEMLPNADPSYLREQARALAHQSEFALKKFVGNAIENNDYPTMEDYMKNQQQIEEVQKYTSKFNIQHFLTKFPDPEGYFCDPDRRCSLGNEPDEERTKEEEIYAVTFLYNYYGYLRKKDIDKIFRINSHDLIKTCARLDTMRRAMKTPRRPTIIETVPKNIRLLQEIAYLKHRKDIRKIIKEYNIQYCIAKEQARHNGLLQTCSCCFDEELIPEECYFCKNGCIFCKDCVKNGAEAVIGEGKLDFPCLADCGADFSIPTLQMVLDSVVFSRMAQRKQMEEIKRANLDGLETCPFCDFATIPPPDSKIFQCLNKECMKESCRECRHVSHIPLRCNEIEYDEDVKMRTYIENKMTEALLRKCWKCSTVFIKESGCNKMTCSCGAMMCYVCGTAVMDYKHFGNDGRCPLWTTDLNRFHADAVMQGAREAKVELGVDKSPSRLKNDPSTDIENHYTISN